LPAIPHGYPQAVDILVLLLLIAAVICFGAAAFGIAGGRINLVAAGLLCWVLTVLIGVAT